MQSDGKQAFDVVIGGGSFAGLALARAIAVCLGPGVSIAVIDQGPMDPDGESADVRASALGAGSWRLLERLGAAERLSGEAEPVLTIDITDSPLEAALRPRLLSYDNRLADGTPASLIVTNRALKRVMEQLARQTPSVTLIGGAEIAGLTVSEHGATVTLGDGRGLTAALVVAADGRRSRLRELAGIQITQWSSGQVGIVTNVFHGKPHQGRAMQHFLPAGPIAMLPLPDRAGRHRSSIVWSEAREEGYRLAGLCDERFLDELDRRLGGRLGELALDGGRSLWPLESHLARSMIGDRLAVVGDAAHGVHPLAGQGVNLAFRDVAALVECLADGARIGLDLGAADTLERYQRWRRSDAALSAAAFDGLNRLFANDNALLRAARGIGLGVVDRLEGLKRHLVAEAAGLAGDVPKLLAGGTV